MAEDKNPDNRLAFTKRPLGDDIPFTKGALPQPTEYARGGPVLMGRSVFMKTADTFRTDDQRQDYKKDSPGGERSDVEGDSKSESPVKPRT